MSAGNSGAWMDHSYSPTGHLYAGDVSMTTTGMPGTFANALSVASVDNRGFTGNVPGSCRRNPAFYTDSSAQTAYG